MLNQVTSESAVRIADYWDQMEKRRFSESLPIHLLCSSEWSSECHVFKKEKWTTSLVRVHHVQARLH